MAEHTGLYYYTKAEIDEKLGAVLYSDAAGTNSTVTLSDDASNYDYLAITFCDNNDTPNKAVRIIPADAARFVLDIAHAGSSNTVYWNVARYTLSGTSITVGNSYEKALAASSISTSSTNHIYILKVVGMKNRA